MVLIIVVDATDESEQVIMQFECYATDEEHHGRGVIKVAG